MKPCYCNCVCARGKRVQDLEARIKELEQQLYDQAIDTLIKNMMVTGKLQDMLEYVHQQSQ